MSNLRMPGALKIQQELLKESTISIYAFLGIFLAYAFTSFLTFAFTTSGWMGIIVLAAGWIPYAVVFVILLIIALFKRAENKIWMQVRPVDFAPLAITQFLVLFFNFGDCGDAPGGVFFFQRLFLTGDICRMEFSDAINAFIFVWRALMWVYVGIAIFSFVAPLVAASEKGKPRKRRISVWILSVLILLIAIGAYANGLAKQKSWESRRQVIDEIEVIMGRVSEESCKNLDTYLLENNLFATHGSYQFSCWTTLARRRKQASYCNNIVDRESKEKCIQRLMDIGVGSPPLEPFDCSGIDSFKNEQWYKNLVSYLSEYYRVNLENDEIRDACKSSEYFIALKQENNKTHFIRFEFGKSGIAGAVWSYGTEATFEADRFGELEENLMSIYKQDCLVGTINIRSRVFLPSGTACSQ